MLRNDPKAPPQHLDYLLTAYLFENLSAAGRAEVESHLAYCPACRQELENLRAVLSIAESALDSGGKEYVFEEQRKRRVLEAAKNTRHIKIFRNNSGSSWLRFSWKLGAVAAMLFVAVVIIFVNFSDSRETTKWAYNSTRDREPLVTTTTLSRSQEAEDRVDV